MKSSSPLRQYLGKLEKTVWQVTQLSEIIDPVRCRSAAARVIKQTPEVNIIMNIAEARQGSNLVISPSGRIDSQNSPVFDRHLSAVIDRGDVNLIIDLTGLEYISSTGLSAFLSAAKKIRSAGGRMALAGVNNRIRLVFEMSGFLRLFPIYQNVEAALSD